MARAVTLSLGVVVQLDTSAATTGPADARANRACGAPFTNASVWYRFTPDRRLAFRLDMSDSDYEGGFMVFRGAPSEASMVTCGPDRLTVFAAAGVTFRRQCDGAWQPFMMELVSPTHRFGGGWAKLHLRAVSCNDVGCTRGAIEDLQTKMRHG